MEQSSTGIQRAEVCSVLKRAGLMQIAKTFKEQQVLKDISWDVKRGERVGLVGELFSSLEITEATSGCPAKLRP